MKTLLLLLASALSLTLIPSIGRADGIFVAPKFVWDKHKDINEPTQKAIIVYDAGREDLILQVKYEGPVDQFGWLIPVPNLPTVQKGSMKCFYELSEYTQEHFESRYGAYGRDQTMGRSASASLSASAPPPVEVVEIKTVGAYEIAVLSAKDSGALKKWLDDNHFYLPPDKSGVIDSYIQQQWYFVAVKINLDKSLFNLASTSSNLASGELNPLQIRFESDHCVFPLRISSLSGKPSEVQLYVLSSEPLLEHALFKKQLPLIYSNDMARVEGQAQRMENMKAQMQERMNARREEMGLPSMPPRLDAGDQEQMIQRLRENPVLEPGELPQFAKTASGDLPECTRDILEMASGSWWVTKDTWTFQPDEMLDLDFEPALPAFAETLGSKYGYIAAAGLNAIGADAIPVLMDAMQSPNLATRADVAPILDQPVYTSDPRIQSAAPSWLTNSEPTVRKMAIYVLADNPEPGYIKSLVPLLSDENADVRDAAVFVISRDQDDLPKFAPIFQKMLTDTNPAVRVSGLRLAFAAGVNMDRNEWLSFLKIPDKRALGVAASHFRGRDMQYDLSDDEAAALLQNTEPLGRLIGLEVLREHADRHAVELARPLLNDNNATVRFIAERDLQKMTGQDPASGY